MTMSARRILPSCLIRITSLSANTTRWVVCLGTLWLASLAVLRPIWWCPLMRRVRPSEISLCLYFLVFCGIIEETVRCMVLVFFWLYHWLDYVDGDCIIFLLVGYEYWCLKGCVWSKESILPVRVRKVILPIEVGKVILPMKVRRVILPMKVRRVILPIEVGKVILPMKVGKVILPIEVGKVILPMKVRRVILPMKVRRVILPIEVGKVILPMKVGKVILPIEVGKITLPI